AAIPQSRQPTSAGPHAGSGNLACSGLILRLSFRGVRSTNPESRDSGFASSTRPGMTNAPFGAPSDAPFLTRCRDNLPPSLRGRDTAEFRRLALEQPAIDSPRPVGERGVGALLDDLAAIEHQDAVEAAH